MTNLYYDMLGIVKWKRNKEVHFSTDTKTEFVCHPSSDQDHYLESNDHLEQSEECHPSTSHEIFCFTQDGNALTEDSNLTHLSKWQSLQSQVSQCTACSLHQSRTQTVFGVGNNNAQLMLIGEAPGFYEDQQGEPFVGRAGQLLNAMLAAMGLHRNDVYIANILKCRPPNNRDPNPDEVTTCTTFLDQQITLINPHLIIALGRIAAHYLLKTKSSLESLRNQTHYYGQQKTPLIVTYHPAYLLRNPKDKKKAYSDLQFTEQVLSLHAKV